MIRLGYCSECEKLNCRIKTVINTDGTVDEWCTECGGCVSHQPFTCVDFTLTEAERVWLISDTHFDHTNIIKYCNRPFVSTGEMNECLLRNWRRTIAPGDLVYFLGDMAFGRGSRNPRWWVAQLSGRIVWVKGSHDHGVRPSSVVPGAERVVLTEFIRCDGIAFMLVHDTFDAVASAWTGWIIHGHNHNNRPHIDNRFGHKCINVSVEVIDYKPVSLAQVVRRIRELDGTV